MTENPAHGVLVVEDDPAIRRLVMMVLQRQGYRTETAADGMEAVVKLDNSAYDVIVLDLMMPNLDGFSFLNRLAERQPDRLSSVIVTSAASPNLIRERMNGKTFQVLPKPFDIHELVGAVRLCIASQNPAANPLT